MNHHWKDNTCTRCGVKREKKSWRRLMAVLNHPPWEAWVYGNGWHYGATGFKRPECTPIQGKK